MSAGQRSHHTLPKDKKMSYKYFDGTSGLSSLGPLLLLIRIQGKTVEKEHIFQRHSWRITLNCCVNQKSVINSMELIRRLLEIPASLWCTFKIVKSLWRLLTVCIKLESIFYTFASMKCNLSSLFCMMSWLISVFLQELLFCTISSDPSDLFFYSLIVQVVVSYMHDVLYKLFIQNPLKTEIRILLLGSINLFFILLKKKISWQYNNSSQAKNIF